MRKGKAYGWSKQSLTMERAFATHQVVRDTLEVTEPRLTLRGFPGSAQHTRPFILTQVLQTRKLYGGEVSTARLGERIAEEGREYTFAVLRRFGQVRQTFIAGRNPEAAKY